MDIAGAGISAGRQRHRRGFVGHVHHHHLAARALIAVGVDANLLAAVLGIRPVVDYTGGIVGVCATRAAGECGGAGLLKSIMCRLPEQALAPPVEMPTTYR